MNSQTTTITIVRLLRVWYEKIYPMTTKFLRTKKTCEIPNLQNEMDGVIAIVFPHHQKVFIDFTDFFLPWNCHIHFFFRSGSKLLRNVILMIGYYSVNGVCSCCCCCGIIFLIVKKFFVDIWSFVVEKERKITTATFDLVQIFREIATPHSGVM